MRQVKNITITDEGRDLGKTFCLREMSAEASEEWALRALLALTKGGFDIGDAAGGGMAKIAMMGLQSLGQLEYKDLKPLLDEMFNCVTFCPDKKHPGVERPLLPDDIDEVATRLLLRAEVFTLHTGFSMTEAKSKRTSVKKTKG